MERDFIQRGNEERNPGMYSAEERLPVMNDFCPNCGAKMERYDPAKQDAPTESHSERDILDGCIALMQILVGHFEDYLDYMDVQPENEEDVFGVRMSYAEIVNRLFLWKTYHSGGTSTRNKCRELGVDGSESITFSDDRAADYEETEDE